MEEAPADVWNLARIPSSALEEELRRGESHPVGAGGEPRQQDQMVPELVDTLRRRQRELAALYATVKSLAALAEVDEALASIVRNAHNLMSSDITYLSTFDDFHRELVLQAAEGVISPEFRAARVPAQTGVAGKVVETRAPFWVSDYSSATDLKHDPAFDRAVCAEGLVAVLGVPLVARGRIFGILYAAYRSNRPFLQDEVALLSAFADHAAVALDNARLYHESRRAVHELEAAYQTIQAQAGAAERAASVHEALTRLVLSRGGARALADMLADELDAGVEILDRDDQVIAVSGGIDVTAFARRGDVPVPRLDRGGALSAAVDESRRTGHCVTIQTTGEGRLSAVAVLADRTYLGALVLAHDRVLHSIDERTFERAAQIMGLSR